MKALILIFILLAIGCKEQLEDGPEVETITVYAFVERGVSCPEGWIFTRKNGPPEGFEFSTRSRAGTIGGAIGSIICHREVGHEHGLGREMFGEYSMFLVSREEISSCPNGWFFSIADHEVCEQRFIGVHTHL